MSDSPTSSSSTPDVLRDALLYVDSWLEYRVWKLRAPGAQVAVWFDGKIQFSKAYGHSNLETGEELTSDHLFRVASHSKTFTATAVMQLLEAGKLRLDDTAGQWISQLIEQGSSLAKVTVRELLSHSAGVIRDGLDANFWSHSRPFPDEAELLEIAIGEGTIRQPESTFKYTNIGYSLLGLIVGAASGSTYNDYVASHIVDKLGLTKTGPELIASRSAEYAGGHSGLSSSYERKVIPHVDTRAMASATGFFSTAEEMVTFASAHFHGDDRLISDQSKNEMQRPVWTAVVPDAWQSGYGYGTTVDTYNRHRMVGHSGGYPGHITRTMWDPHEGLAISVLTNAVDGPAEELAAGVLEILDRSRKQAGSLALTSGLTNSAAIPPVSDSGDEIDKWTFTGRFAALWGVTDIVLLGDSLLACSPIGPSPLVNPYELAVVDANTLRIMSGVGFASVGEHFRFERDANGTILSVFTGGMKAWPIEVYRARESGL
ncbi:MAG: serine hydrolase domain-containing protein [Thermomicrobiales bacterium]